MNSDWPTLSDVYAAARAIRDVTLATPVVRSNLGTEDAPLWLKLETLQPSGAFKLRGASNALAKLSADACRRGVVCCSTGNHGAALAYAAREMGVPATVCVSELVPDTKLRVIETLGASVVRKGKSQDEAQCEAARLVVANGLTNIPPFDHFDVIAGQGTIGLELMQALPELDCILIPLSGGGLAAGIALAAKAMKPDIRVVGITMDRGAAMAESLRAGQPVLVTEVPSLADSLGGGIGLENRLTFAMCRDLIDDVVLVTEAEIYRGIQTVFMRDRIVAEGASAVGHAVILAGKVALTGPTATILSGCNVDMDQFQTVIANQPVTLGDLIVKGE